VGVAGGETENPKVVEMRNAGGRNRTVDTRIFRQEHRVSQLPQDMQLAETVELSFVHLFPLSQVFIDFGKIFSHKFSHALRWRDQGRWASAP
jgi:hypothetical protein